MTNLYEEQERRWIARWSALQAADRSGMSNVFQHPQDSTVWVLENNSAKFEDDMDIYAWQCTFPDRPDLKEVWIFND